MASQAEDFESEIYDEVEEVYAMHVLADPVLAELWNNDKDAEYDHLEPGL
jgi:hypothetical protein